MRLVISFCGGDLNGVVYDTASHDPAIREPAETYLGRFNAEGWPTVGKCYRCPIDPADISLACDELEHAACYRLANDTDVAGTRTLVCAFQG